MVKLFSALKNFNNSETWDDITELKTELIFCLVCRYREDTTALVIPETCKGHENTIRRCIPPQLKYNVGVPNTAPKLFTRSSDNLTTRSGKPTTTRAKEPVSASIRLGEKIFWSTAALRFSLGSCSHDTIWGTDTSAVMVGANSPNGHDERQKGKEMLRLLRERNKNEHVCEDSRHCSHSTAGGLHVSVSISSEQTPHISSLDCNEVQCPH